MPAATLDVITMTKYRRTKDGSWQVVSSPSRSLWRRVLLLGAPAALGAFALLSQVG
jgi:hypothetical protein